MMKRTVAAKTNLFCRRHPSSICCAITVLMLALAGIRPANAAATIQVEYAQYWAGEATDFVVVGVIRGPDAETTATVDFTTAMLTASAGADYTESQGTLNFGPGDKLKLVTISILNDGIREPDERFQVRLSNATGDALGARIAATVTIRDNDPGIEFASNQLWVHEDQGGIELTVLRGNDKALDPFTVDYTFTDISAEAGEDYQGTNGTLEFAAGEMSKSTWVRIVNDQTLEADERFQVRLSNPSAAATLGRSTNQSAVIAVVDVTGMAARSFQRVRQLPDDSIELSLAGAVSSRFKPFFSIFQLETSADLKRWEPLRLFAHLNSSTNPALYVEPQSTKTRFYRLASIPLITPNLPPSGPYAVGLVKRMLTDSSRRNRYNVSTNGSFMISIWYPGIPEVGQLPEPFYEKEMAQNVSRFSPPSSMDRSPRFASYSIPQADLVAVDQGYPVILYSHGFGGFGSYRGDNIAAAENLASHGYVVVAVEHFDTALTVFLDGSYFIRSLVPTFAENEDALRDRVRDLSFALDQLEEINRTDPILAGALNLSQVAAFGWSWGAVTAGEFCRVDARCKGAISLDGGAPTTQTAPELLLLGLQKPSLMLNNSANRNDYLFSKAIGDAYWIQIRDSVHADFSAYYWRTRADIASGQEAVRTINAYVLSFLNKYLKGKDDHLLDGPSPDYPRVSSFRKK